MKELRLIEMMGNIDEELLIRANAPVPLFGKPRFRNAFIASAVAVLLAVTMIASPVAVAVSYGNAHPEIEGGLVYVMDAMIKDESHFLSSLLPESAKNTLNVAHKNKFIEFHRKVPHRQSLVHSQYQFHIPHNEYYGLRPLLEMEQHTKNCHKLHHLLAIQSHKT